MNDVIKLSYIDDVIALVVMEDRENRNTFSQDFMQGLQKAFVAIANNTIVKTVVIHGYDNFFCCGGTKEELIKLTDGKMTFADLPFYRILLDCEVPVIAAMQGHAIGGGFALGCFADLLVMAEEAFYATNFMKYGFTPGFGSTYIVEKRLGKAIADSMLLGAQNYQGGQLKQWGASTNIVKKADVIPTAIALAKTLSQKPRNALMQLKAHLSAEIKRELPAIIEQEVAMHRVTFGRPEVKQRINELFGR